LVIFLQFSFLGHFDLNRYLACTAHNYRDRIIFILAAERQGSNFFKIKKVIFASNPDIVAIDPVASAMRTFPLFNFYL